MTRRRRSTPSPLPAVPRVRPTALLGVVLAALLVTGGCGGASPGGDTSTGGATGPGGASTPATKQVTYLTAFGVAGRDAFAWVAQAKGFYRAAGLDVTIVPGAATGENLKVLAGGRAQFASMDLTGAWILAGKGQYRDFRTVAALHQQSLVSVMALSGTGITKPGDLAGRTIGAATASVNQLLFPAYARRAGFDPASVRWVNVQPAQLPALLATGRVQALSTFLIGRKGIEKAAGRTAVVLPYRDYLPSLFGNGIVTPKHLADTDPELVRRFRDASLQGLRYTVAHPDEAAAILHRAQPTSDPEAAVGEITAMTPFVGSGSRVGAISRDQVAGAIATLQDGGLIPAGLAPDDVVDFALAPAA